MTIFDKAWIAAKEQGAQHLEVFQLKSRESEIKVFQQETRAINKAINYGVGIRVIAENKVGYAFTTDINKIELTARKAAAGALETTADENNVLPQPGESKPLDIYKEDLEKLEFKIKNDFLLEVENSAVNFDKRIKPADAVYGEDIAEVEIQNSFGLDEYYKLSRCSVFLRVVAEQRGDSQSGFEIAFGRQLSEMGSAAEIGEKAAEKAISLLGGKKISTRTAPVIFDPMVGSQLVGLLGSAVSADAAQKHKSFLADKLGQKISGDVFQLIDDGLLEGAFGSSPVDDEGVPCQRTVVIEKGVVNSFLHNSYTAKKAAAKSTGNASRHSFKTTPSIGPTNIFIEPTNISKDELLNSVDQGFYVVDVSGVHAGANPITGEFSVGATGYWLKNGAPQHAVREVTISGNLLEIVGSIDKIADDLRFFPFMGSCGSPTLLIRQMVISGI
jgi:PmbA protein